LPLAGRLVVAVLSRRLLHRRVSGLQALKSASMATPEPASAAIAPPSPAAARLLRNEELTASSVLPAR